MLNRLQIYTDYPLMQVIAREMRLFVNNLTDLLIKPMHFVDIFEISITVRD